MPLHRTWRGFHVGATLAVALNLLQDLYQFVEKLSNYIRHCRGEHCSSGGIMFRIRRRSMRIRGYCRADERCSPLRCCFIDPALIPSAQSHQVPGDRKGRSYGHEKNPPVLRPEDLCLEEGISHAGSQLQSCCCREPSCRPWMRRSYEPERGPVWPEPGGSRLRWRSHDG